VSDTKTPPSPYDRDSVEFARAFTFFDAVYAFALSCPHQNTALKWDERDHGFQCPKHHSKFQPDGAYIPGSGRATRNMDRYAIQMQPSGVTVDLDKVFEEDSDGPQWTAAVVRLDGKVSANSKS